MTSKPHWPIRKQVRIWIAQLSLGEVLQRILVVIILVDTRNHSFSVYRLQRVVYPVHRFFDGLGVHGDGVGNVGVVALSVKNRIVAALLQSCLPILLCKAQDAKAAAEGLNRILELLNDPLDENFRLRTNEFSLRQKIRLIPIPIIGILLRHVRRDHDPAFRRIAPVVCTDQIAVFIVDVNLRCACTNLKRLLKIFPRHGVVNVNEKSWLTLTVLRSKYSY